MAQKFNNRFKGCIDTTLRDGQQSPLLFDTYKYRFSLEDKKTLVNGLIQLGVTHIEFFSPVVSAAEKEDFLQLKKYIPTITDKKISLLAHCRCHPVDIEQAVKAGFDGLNFYIGVANHKLDYSKGKSFSEVVKLIRNTLRTTRKQYPHLYLRFSIEDCFRTSIEDVYRVYDEIADYVDTFGMPDTVGIATPDMVKERVTALHKRYPKVDLECHFHNDRGFSLINAVTAVQYGASYIDTAIWGMAERSGITSLTGLLFNLFYEDKKYCEAFNLSLCYPLNVLMGSILKTQVPYNEPVSVTNRTHTAGVHQKAVLNNKYVYEAHDLSVFGVNKNELILGPLSGWNLIYYYLREVEYYDLTQELAKEIAHKFKLRVDGMSKSRKPDVILKEIVASYNLPKIPTESQYLKKRIEHL